MPKKILVTGANGQLGSEIKDLAPASTHLFLFTDIDSLDLSDRKQAMAFLRKEKPDYIINCAAYTAVDKAESEPEKAMQINAGIPEILSSYGTESGSFIIHISTDYVFEGNSPFPLKETDPASPPSAYGKSKLAGEKVLLNYKNSLIIRTSWLYSSYGNNFVKSMIRLMAERDELGVVFDQTGSPTNAEDLARAILHIIGDSENIPMPGIYHYSNEGVASWYDFALEISSQTGANCKIVPITTDQYPLPAPRPAYAVLNKEKIKKEFKLDIAYWKDSLSSCLEKLNP